MTPYDLAVLGGGPAGVTAALRACELGASVALIERGNLGGTCTNDGCVPTRVLAKTARLLRDSRQFAEYGILLERPPEVDFAAVLKRTQQVVYQVQEKKQLLDHLRDVQVETFIGAGNARFVSPQAVELRDGQRIEAERFILAVGGAARRLNFPGAELALTHSDVWGLDHLPRSVVIVGCGATGCQLASVFDAFGTRVTLVDVAPRILMAEDALVAETMAEQFRQAGIQIVTGIDGLARIEAGAQPKLKRLIYTQGGAEQTLEAEDIILSVGWPGNIDALNLSAAGVQTERSYVQVNDSLQTSAAHIYAAGDITGRMMLVQSASAQARIAVENALLGPTRLADHKLVPHGGFTDPEYGSVGLTEAQAREKGDPAVAVVPYADMDRAVIDDRTVGFCKLVVDRASGLVIGAHVVGEQAVEVVQMVAAGMAGGLNAERLADLEFAYPTFAAIVGLAARQIVRELGRVPVSPEWRALKQIRGAEWERQD
ncbi:MAG: NAD(P)/FAD-dependent oxidoreductase [Anaerolineae bacterium]|nr:NAD(P)/FAD-dependent oxidoreductase [Anaerolineae bacterium]